MQYPVTRFFIPFMVKNVLSTLTEATRKVHANVTSKYIFFRQKNRVGASVPGPKVVPSLIVIRYKLNFKIDVVYELNPTLKRQSL